MYAVIQGTADVDKHLSQEELARTIEFCKHAFEPTLPEDRDAVLAKLKSLAEQSNVGAGIVLADATNLSSGKGEHAAVKPEAFKVELTEGEQNILNQMKAREFLGRTDKVHMEGFTAEVIDGYLPRMETGSLGLVLA